jgi:histidinol-phosphate phosphatase family protein
MSSRPAIFLDRDGVLNELVVDHDSGQTESPTQPGDVRLIGGVVESLQKITALPIALVCVTNQPAAAKGSASLEELVATHTRVMEMLSTEGVNLDSRVCYHYPAAVLPALAQECFCRKPQPGMLLAAANDLDVDLSRSWMIGDSSVDIEAGARAGCRNILVECEASAHRRQMPCFPDARVPNLAAAVQWLLSHEYLCHANSPCSRN